jgi:tyrosyl-tRNA synthetase
MHSRGRKSILLLFDNKAITGKVMYVGVDFVCVNSDHTANYVPFHAIVHFQKAGTETFSANFIG